MTFFDTGFPSLRTLLLWVALGFVFPNFLQADDVRITANLSAPTTTVDEPVRLTVTIVGARNASMPARIDAEGLEIDFRGKSQQFEMSTSFGVSTSTVLTYSVTPEKAGHFTIPSISIQVGGKAYATDPLELSVEKGANSAGGNDGDPKTAQMFAEMIIPQDSAYVGEIVPVEVRFYFEAGVNAQLNPPGQVPQIDGEGFTKLRYPPARVDHKVIKGKDYQVLAYQTGLVAAKSGDLEIGSASLDFVVDFPQKRRQRNPLNDPFSDDFFNNNPFFANQRVQREISLHTDPAKLHIKALPSPRPAGFDGAVGQFTLQTSAKPARVNMGDPITYTSVISGRGNFDSVAAPQLTETDGWHTYPPAGKLASHDDMGVSGDKTFDMAMIPEKKATALPGVSFVYFDPIQSKYVTLRSASIPIQIDGRAITAAPAATPDFADATAAAGQPAKPAATDLPALKTTLSSPPGSFLPVWKTSNFWVFQMVPLLLLGALAWPKLAAAWAPDERKVRKDQLQRERKRAESDLRSRDPRLFFPAIARCLEIDAALAVYPDKPPSNAAEIIGALHLSDDDAIKARQIFARRDEIAYAGGRGEAEMTAETQRRFTSILGVTQ